jgi:hypothetical protein
MRRREIRLRGNGAPERADRIRQAADPQQRNAEVLPRGVIGRI